jgi:hypothetical protein
MPDEAESEAQSIAVLEATKKEPRLSIYLGLLPVLVFLVLVIGLWLFPPSLVIFEPEFLLPAFNSFLFLSAAIIAIIALRSYLLSGSSTVLWFGCGVLTLGTGALAAGCSWLPSVPMSTSPFSMSGPPGGDLSYLWGVGESGREGRQRQSSTKAAAGGAGLFGRSGCNRPSGKTLLGLRSSSLPGKSLG